MYLGINALFYFPNIQYDAAFLLVGVGGAEEEGVVEPGITAIFGGLKLRGGLEVGHGLPVFIKPVVAEPTIADVDIHAIIGLDAVDGL